MRTRSIRIFFSLSLALLLGTVVSMFLSAVGGIARPTKVVYAAQSDIVPYPPTVTVVASALITTSNMPTQPVSIMVLPNCGETDCLAPNGSLQVSVVSVFSKNLTTNDSATVLKTFVSTPFSLPRTFNYDWTVPRMDNVQVVLTATAINGQPVVGVSPPITITVDTVAPQIGIPEPDQAPWISTPVVVYTWSPATDGAGIASYQINITDTETYTAVFATQQTAFTFTQFITDGVGYYARLRAIDAFGNVGNWSDLSPVVMLDVSAPTVVITAPTTHSGLDPFSVQWQAVDRHSGISQVTLTYTGPGTINGSEIYTSFVGTSSQFGSFTLPQNDMAIGTYTFTLQADNHVGESSLASQNTEVVPVVIFLPLVLKNYPPQWTRGGGTAGGNFHGASFCGHGSTQVWYAGTTQNGVWKSTDNGSHWSNLIDNLTYSYPVIANPNDVQCEEAFVSLWGAGVNKIVGQTITAINNNLSDLYIYGLAVTGTTFYVGTNSGGVFKTDLNTINWQPVNNGILDQRIRSVNIVGDKIYAGARNCKLYISDNQGNSWTEETVLTSDCNDAQVWSVAQIGTTRFAGLGDHGLYMSQNDGNWTKVSSIPSNTIFGLAYDDVNQILYVSAYGSGIYRCFISGGSVQCSAYNNGLATQNTRELAIENGRVVVGTDDGVWYLDTFN